MNKYIDKIDKNISSYRTITHSNMPFIHKAYCSENGDFSVRLASNIITTRRPNANNFQSWKSFYIQEVCSRNAEQFPDDTLNFIYFGNGRNDFISMEIIRKYNGKAICPQNSRTAVKGLCDFVGGFEDLRGITDGLNQYIKTLQPNQDKTIKDSVLEK